MTHPADLELVRRTLPATRRCTADRPRLRTATLSVRAMGCAWAASTVEAPPTARPLRRRRRRSMPSATRSSAAAGLGDLGRLFPAGDPGDARRRQPRARPRGRRRARSGGHRPRPGRPHDPRRAAPPRGGAARARCGRRSRELIGLDPSAVCVKAATGNLAGDEGAGRDHQRRPRSSACARREPAPSATRSAARSSRSSPSSPGTCACTAAARPSTRPRTSATSGASCSPTSCAAYLLFAGYRVTWVMNITDVDDKIIRDAAAAGISIGELTERSHAQRSSTDLAAPAHRRRPTSLPRATDAHPDMARAHRDAPRARARLPDRRRLRSSSGSRRGRRTARSRASTPIAAAAWASASRPTSTARTTSATSRSGRAAKPGEPSWSTRRRRGTAGLAHRVLGDEHALPRASRSTSTPAASTSSSPTTRTRSPSRRRRPAQTFVRTWLHCAHLQMGGEKMAKRVGNLAAAGRALRARRARPGRCVTRSWPRTTAPPSSSPTRRLAAADRRGRAAPDRAARARRLPEDAR